MMLQKRLEPLLSRKRVAIVEACIIGVVSGLAAVSLKQGVEWLTLWRNSSTFPLWISLPLIGLVGGVLSGWLVERLAPEASGSGIPQVKAAIGCAPIPLNLRVALVKLGSTLLALGSGLSLGAAGAHGANWGRVSRPVESLGTYLARVPPAVDFCRSGGGIGSRV